MPDNKRVIAISDIHGNLELFGKLLSQINYNQEDILILVGDLIEKGEQSLETLRYIMELSECGTVHAVSGNCDTIWEDVKYEIDDANLLRYMLLRKHTILNEMCKELSIKVHEGMDIKAVKAQLMQSFGREFDFLEQLPHIIETEKFIFVHGGIATEELEQQEAAKAMKNDAFMEQGLGFSKFVIAGHWPTVNYCRQIGCYNPIINKEQRIISIDGGNAIKSDGQLNALIIENNDIEGISFEAADLLPRKLVAADQAASTNSIFISWMDNAIEVLDRREEFSLCRHLSTGHKLWIKNNQLFAAAEGMRCNDSTDYLLPVSKGDTVAVIESSKKHTLVKKNGTVGWLANEKLLAE